MSASSNGYTPPAVWEPCEEKDAWGRECLAALSGKPWPDKVDEKLPGPGNGHDIQLYSLGTPNGQKVTILLEELGIEYDAYHVNIMKGDQFSREFMDVCPNAHIPCMVDKSVAGGLKMFESCSILLYLATKYKQFIPDQVADPQGYADCVNWLFWQAGNLGPALGRFVGAFVYTPDSEKHKPSIDKATLEAKRLLAVLNTRLGNVTFLAGVANHHGDDPTIADFAVYPWIKGVLKKPKAPEFLSFESDYPYVVAWVESLGARKGVQRGMRVNVLPAMNPEGISERHSKTDFAPECY